MNHRAIPLILCAAGLAAADVACPRLATAPVIDGDLADWAGRPALEMSRPELDDLAVDRACLGWDDAGLHLAIAVKDGKLLNLGNGARIADGDCADLRLILPDGRLVRLLVSPVTAAGGPAMHLSSRSEVKGPVSELAAGTAPSADGAGVRWAAKSDAAGWTVEAMVPWSLLRITPAAGAGLPFVLVAWDHDAPDDWKEWHRRIESANQKKQESWPRLLLAP